MRVKIISDGTVHGTRVVDADNPERVIEGVVAVDWQLAVCDSTAIVTLCLDDVDIEVEGEVRQ